MALSPTSSRSSGSGSQTLSQVLAVGNDAGSQNITGLADVQLTGLTGATGLPLIVAGGNTSGAPASGAHVAGELAGDGTGKLWFCTVSGTPGTWVQIGSSATPSIVQSAQVSLTGGNITTTSTTFTDLTGATSTITTGAHRCLIMFNATVLAAGSHNACFDIAIDGSRQGQTYGLQFAGGNASAGNVPMSLCYLSAVLSAASHTFKIQWRSDDGTSMQTWASTSFSPAVLTVIETGLTV